MNVPGFVFNPIMLAIEGAAAAKLALALAKVPPENANVALRIRVLTRLAAAPKTFLASS